MDYNKEIIKLRYLVEAEFELTPEEFLTLQKTI